MNAVIETILIIVALILMGVFATFFIVANWIKQEIKRNEGKNGKFSK